jgi:hypothetical protein
MKQAIRCAALAAVIVAPLSMMLASGLHAQTANGTNGALPGGHSSSDTNKPANGDHGNNNGNGG